MHIHDVVFLHPPLSFQKLDYPLGGLFEAATGTTDLLNMMPMGMLSLTNELHRAGYDVCLHNVAKSVQAVRGEVRSTCIDEVALQYRARIYGIGLHWAAHAPGALALARMCKQADPGCIVLFGGLSATFFTEELLRSGVADAVARAEVDGHMVDIVKGLSRPRTEWAQVPCVAWLDGAEVRRNPRRAPQLSGVDYLDTHGLLRPKPDLQRFDRDAVMCNIPTLRGCSMECLFCGAGRSAYGEFFGRPRTEAVPVAVILDHTRRAMAAGVSSLKLFGDLRVAGKAYVAELLEGFRSIDGLGDKLDLFLELFFLADADFLRPFRQLFRELHVSISPESTHFDLRAGHGKSFSNDDLLGFADVCKELDVHAWYFFTYVLPGHTPQNLEGELQWMRTLMEKAPAVAAMSLPYLFVDPASPIFNRPEDYGFRIRMKTLADIVDGLERPYWLYSIGYETAHFTVEQIHRSTCELTLGQAQIYFDTGRMASRDLLKTMKGIRCNTAMGERLTGTTKDAEARPSDERIQAIVEQEFPEHLRRSNSNLLIRAFLGESMSLSTAPAALFLDAFPGALEIRLRADPDAEALFEQIDAWTRQHHDALEGWLRNTALPEAAAALYGAVLAPTSLSPAVIGGMARFEWAVFQLLVHGPAAIEGQRLDPQITWTRFDHDFSSIGHLVEQVYHGRSIEPNPTLGVFTASAKGPKVFVVGGAQELPTAEQVRVWEMSMVERRLVATEPALLKVLARIMGVEDPMAPRHVVDQAGWALDDLHKIIRKPT